MSIVMYKIVTRTSQLSIEDYLSGSDMEVYCGQYYQNIFSWANTNFNNQKMRVFFLSLCFHCQNTLHLGKHFHGQSATFSWAKHNIFMGKLNCVLSLHECRLTSVVFLLC